MPAERYWCVVPAAGMGTRLGQGVAKQYRSLAGATVLEVTVSRLLAMNLFELLVLVLAENDSDWCDKPGLLGPRIVTATGGAERSDSVLAGLHALSGKAAPRDWVMVHDAARPCFREENIIELARDTREAGQGGLLALPVADTLKHVDREGRVLQTVERGTLWRAQTPQCFRVEELTEALVSVQASGTAITDEAAAMELAGHRPRVVPGREDNIKITHVEDLPLAEYFLGEMGYRN